MKYQPHWYLFSQLVSAYSKQDTSFRFTKHMPLDEQTIEHSHKQQKIFELEEELFALKNLLSGLQNVDKDRYQLFLQKIAYLEEVLEEKKK